MPIRNLDELWIPEGRFRSEYTEEHLAALERSIREVGLLHPPVVAEDGMVLAGATRTIVLKRMAARGEAHVCNGKTLRPGLVLASDIKELTELQRRQVEYDENEVRIAISWQDKARAVSMLHDLREVQKETTRQKALDDANELDLNLEKLPNQSPEDTAAELHTKSVEELTRREIRDVSNDLAVAAWLEAHPDDKEVAGAKNRGDALKIIQQRYEDERREALARRFLKNTQEHRHILQHVDCIEAISNTPDGVYDCIITDPPWGVNADSWQNGSVTARPHAYSDSIDVALSLYQMLAIEGFRVAKAQAHAYVFCAFHHFENHKKLFLAAGWDVWPRPLIWWRGSQGIAPRPGYGPKNTYECILFANKGNRPTLRTGNDVILASKPSSEESRPGGKPPAVYYELMLRTMRPGDLALDPFCGTGPVFPAANALKAQAVGYDMGLEAIGLASKQLNVTYKPPSD